MKAFLALIALTPCLVLTAIGYVAGYCWCGLSAGWRHGEEGFCKLVDACDRKK